jgi:hypothetical protein
MKLMESMKAEQEIMKIIESGESLLWTGIPRQGIIFSGRDAFLLPFSLMWGGFAIFWEVTAIRMGAPLFFLLWGIPFVIIGLYLIFGRFLVDAKIRSKTLYGLTDHRVIIVSGIFSRTVKSLQLKTLLDVTLRESGDGTGTITFGPSHPMFRWFSGTAWPGAGKYSPPAFERIKAASEVYALIREAQSHG